MDLSGGARKVEGTTTDGSVKVDGDPTRMTDEDIDESNKFQDDDNTGHRSLVADTATDCTVTFEPESSHTGEITGIGDNQVDATEMSTNSKPMPEQSTEDKVRENVTDRNEAGSQALENRTTRNTAEGCQSVAEMARPTKTKSKLGDDFQPDSREQKQANQNSKQSDTGKDNLTGDDDDNVGKTAEKCNEDEQTNNLRDAGNVEDNKKSDEEKQHDAAQAAAADKLSSSANHAVEDAEVTDPQEDSVENVPEEAVGSTDKLESDSKFQPESHKLGTDIQKQKQNDENATEHDDASDAHVQVNEMSQTPPVAAEAADVNDEKKLQNVEKDEDYDDNSETDGNKQNDTTQAADDEIEPGTLSSSQLEPDPLADQTSADGNVPDHRYKPSIISVGKEFPQNRCDVVESEVASSQNVEHIEHATAGAKDNRNETIELETNRHGEAIREENGADVVKTIAYIEPVNLSEQNMDDANAVTPTPENHPSDNLSEERPNIGQMAIPTDQQTPGNEIKTKTYERIQEEKNQQQPEENSTEMVLELTDHDSVDKTVDVSEMHCSADDANATEATKDDSATCKALHGGMKGEKVQDTPNNENETNDARNTVQAKLDASSEHSTGDDSASDQNRPGISAGGDFPQLKADDRRTEMIKHAVADNDTDETNAGKNSQDNGATELDMHTGETSMGEVNRSEDNPDNQVDFNSTQKVNSEMQQGDKEFSSETKCHQHCNENADIDKPMDTGSGADDTDDSFKHAAANNEREPSGSTNTKLVTGANVPCTNGVETISGEYESEMRSDMKHEEPSVDATDEELREPGTKTASLSTSPHRTSQDAEVNDDAHGHVSSTFTGENAPDEQSTVDSGTVEDSCYDELIHFATCPSCGKVTTAIKLLPCMDFFCLDCLQQQLSTQHDSRHEMNCQTCDEVFAVPQQGLEELLSNVYVKPIVPGCVEQPSSRREKQGTLSCSVCRNKKGERSEAELVYCKECRQHLCQQCSRVHRKLRVTEAHHVVINSQRLLLDVDSVKCPSHPTKSLEVFCDDCMTLCCVLCLRQVHYEHNWSDVDTVSERYRLQLNTDAETVRDAGSRCEEQIQQVEDAENMVTEDIQALRDEIDDHRDRLIDTIDREVSKLYDQLCEAQTATTKDLDQTKQRVRKQKQILGCFERFCSAAIETGTVNEVIHVYQSIHCGDAELPLQQVSTDTSIPQMTFTPVKLYDLLPNDAQQLIGSLSVGSTASETATEELPWRELHDHLQESLERLAQLQQQAIDDERKMASLEDQLTEKDQLVEKFRKEVKEKQLIVTELDRETADLKERQTAMTQEMEQKGITLAAYTQQIDSLSQRFHEHEQKYNENIQNYARCLQEQQMRMEQTSVQLQRSEQSAGEYQTAVDQLTGRVEELEYSLAESLSKEQETESQLEDAWHQISEQSLVIDHVPPTAVAVCLLRDQVTPVYGVTSVGHHLYVVRAWSKQIEVYDCSTYSLQRHIYIPDLQDVTDLTGCEQTFNPPCLYLADCNSRAIHAVSTPAGTDVVDRWQLTDKPYGVSVSEDSLVVVSFSEVSTIGIFSDAGQLQRQISVAGQVVNLHHAVVMSTGQLVICHGSLHRQAGVSVIDADGNLVKTIPATAETEADDAQLAWPTHVAVDYRGFVYVADYSGKRVVQLDADLTYITDIVGYDQGLRNPRNISIDSLGRRLYIAESGGNVLVFGLH